jgi:RNA methyltransferase, TrmH family
MTIQKITSPANPAIKMLKGLHLKKGRADTGLFLGEGLRLAIAAAELGRWPEWLAVSTGGLERGGAAKYVAAAAARGVKVIETNDAILAAIAKRENPQTVLGAWRQSLHSLDDIPTGPQALVLVLDQVRDPGNLGTILRTADAVGADGVVLTGGPCDPFSVEAVRASMGSLFAVRLARVEFAAFNAWRRARGLILVGTHLEGAARHDLFPIDQGVALLMGNEQAGLSAQEADACDHLVRIPMRGNADSLNLAVATAVLAYDVWRRRDFRDAPP